MFGNSINSGLILSKCGRIINGSVSGSIIIIASSFLKNYKINQDLIIQNNFKTKQS